MVFDRSFYVTMDGTLDGDLTIREPLRKDGATPVFNALLPDGVTTLDDAIEWLCTHDEDGYEPSSG